MFESILNFFKGLFTAAESQSERVRRLARVAGTLIKLNNPNYVLLADAFKIALTSIESGKEADVDTEILETLTKIMKDSGKPEVVAAISVLLAETSITDASATVNTDGKLELPLIKALVLGLLEGLA